MTSRARYRRALLALGGLLLTTGPLVAEGDARFGERLYRQGLLASGEPLIGTVAGAQVEDKAFHCVACHRRSGFGSVEGVTLVPSVVGAELFAPRRLDRAELFRKLYLEVQAEPFTSRVRDPRLRPAYEEQSLATVLRTGRDPSGRELDPWMPRYAIGEEDVRNLAAYLRGLGAVPDPGVEERRIHFATVVSSSMDPDRRAAMLDVMTAYFRRKNSEVRGLRARPGHSPWHHDDFEDTWREWVLHVWELAGPSATWGEELAAHYRKQPVFALVGGLVEGRFAPVHDFCETVEVPCVFPVTDLPVTSRTGAYTLYLSRGLTGEAEAMARRLAAVDDGARIVQVYRDGERSRIPARALAGALAPREVIDRRLAPEETPDADFWRGLTEDRGARILVLWLPESDLAGLESLAGGPLRKIFLSTSLAGETPRFGSPLAAKIRFVHRFALPGREGPRIYRVRGWLRSRGVAARHERLQLTTYFALSVADHALTHLVTRYDRDFFVESVEHETENALNPGSFSRLSLGPGQRFASKGSWIVKIGGDGRLEPEGERIVP